MSAVLPGFWPIFGIIWPIREIEENATIGMYFFSKGQTSTILRANFCEIGLEKGHLAMLSYFSGRYCILIGWLDITWLKHVILIGQNLFSLGLASFLQTCHKWISKTKTLIKLYNLSTLTCIANMILQLLIDLAFIVMKSGFFELIRCGKSAFCFNLEVSIGPVSKQTKNEKDSLNINGN